VPIYEYRCTEGHTFECLQRMSDDPISSCTVCGAPAARVLHAPAVHFKGSGFYTTDYGKKGRAGAAGESADGALRPSRSRA
jgi:putative FmdB family regulatory protein